MQQPLSPGAEPQVGEQLGSYKLVERLGEGGLGVVFKAFDATTMQHVAVKVLAPRFSRDLVFVTRFLVEARAISKLNHPHIVRVLNIMQQGQLVFFAMEFVDGCSLQVALRQGSLAPLDVAQWMSEAALGLQHAHQHGIIHRDVKPANLVLTSGGQIKVTDFNLGKGDTLRAQDLDAAAAVHLMGSSYYMSPELALGEKVDHRSDIYSLGATMFHLLAGRPLFMGADARAIMNQHINTPAPPIQQIKPDVPSEFNRVLHKCLSKQITGRYQRYEELIADLGHVVPTLQKKAVTTVVQSGRKSRVLVVVAVALLLAAGAGLFFWPKKELPPPPQTAVVTPQPVADVTPTSTVPDINAEAAEQFKRMQAEAQREIDAQRFGAALKVYDSWPTRFRTTRAQNDVNSHRERIRGFAASAWENTKRRADRLRAQEKFEDAAALFNEVERTFGLDDYSAKARDERQQIAQEITRRQNALREYEKQVEQWTKEIQTLMGTNQLDVARKRATDLAATMDPAFKEKFDPVRNDAQKVFALQQKIFQRIAAKPSAVVTLTTRTGKIKGHIARADAITIGLREDVPGGFLERTAKWSELTPESVVQVYSLFLDRNNADEYLSYAILLLYQNQINAARKAFDAVVARDASKKPLVEPYLAQLEARVAAVPVPIAPVTTTPSASLPYEFLPLDIVAACNAQVIATEQKMATDAFDTTAKITWAAAGLVRKEGGSETGLPDEGRVEIPSSNPKGFFQVPIRRDKDAILFSGAKGRQPNPIEIVLSPRQSAAFEKICFLHASVHGDSIIHVTLRYDSGEDEVLRVQTLDWSVGARTKKLLKSQATAVTTRLAKLESVGHNFTPEMVAQTFSIDSTRKLRAITMTLKTIYPTLGRKVEEVEPQFTAGIFAVSALPAAHGASAR